MSFTVSTSQSGRIERDARPAPQLGGSMTDHSGAPAEVDQLAELRATRAIERLSAHRAFAQCTQEDIVALLCAGKRTAIPAQWAFVQEQTPADAAYVILEGNARVFRHGTPVADLQPGDVVGEVG